MGEDPGYPQGVGLAMADFVYVMRADGFGEDPVDLHQCRRFVITSPDDREHTDERIYYLHGDGRWIAELGSLEYNGYDAEVWSPSRRYAHPQEVAHYLLSRFGRLTEGL